MVEDRSALRKSICPADIYFMRSRFFMIAGDSIAPSASVWYETLNPNRKKLDEREK
jgi:hypothetical protein